MGSNRRHHGDLTVCAVPNHVCAESYSRHFTAIVEPVGVDDRAGDSHDWITGSGRGRVGCDIARFQTSRDACSGCRRAECGGSDAHRAGYRSTERDFRAVVLAAVHRVASDRCDIGSFVIRCAKRRGRSRPKPRTERHRPCRVDGFIRDQERRHVVDHRHSSRREPPGASKAQSNRRGQPDPGRAETHRAGPTIGDTAT